MGQMPRSTERISSLEHVNHDSQCRTVWLMTPQILKTAGNKYAYHWSDQQEDPGQQEEVRSSNLDDEQCQRKDTNREHEWNQSRSQTKHQLLPSKLMTTNAQNTMLDIQSN